MVAYTYQLSLFSTVVLLVLGLLIVLTLINWIQRFLVWLAGEHDKKSKPKVKVEPPKMDNQEEQNESEEINEIPDLDQKKGL